MQNQKIIVEMNFCFNTWLAKIIRLSLNSEDLETYAKSVFEQLINDNVPEKQALLIKDFILDYAKLI